MQHAAARSQLLEAAGKVQHAAASAQPVEAEGEVQHAAASAQLVEGMNAGGFNIFAAAAAAHAAAVRDRTRGEAERYRPYPAAAAAAAEAETAVLTTGGWHSFGESVGKASAGKVDTTPDVNRGRCYNRICKYLIHSSGQFGDFCCHKCFRNYNESGGDRDIQENWGEWHGPKCEKHIAPESTPITVTYRLPLKELFVCCW